MHSRRRAYTTYAFMILVLVAILPAKTARAQETTPIYTFQECEQIEDARLRDELNAITQSVFKAEQSSLRVAEIVDRKWVDLDVDATVDVAVDSAIERVRGEEDYWNRVLSGWSVEQAEELTTKVANYAFGSQVFRDTVDQLSKEIADDLADEIGVMTAKSASSALLCVQEFIGNTFSQTMISILDEQIKAGIDETAFGSGVDTNFTDILETRMGSLAGVGIIIGTQVAKRLAQKVAQNIAGKVVVRILGRVATSVIPLAGWIIGAGLILWDLIESGEGALPQIRESLQGPDVKAEIRAQIAEAVDAEMQATLPELARSVANDVFSEWQDLRLKFPRVLYLARTNSRFQTLLDNSTAAQVDKLAELVALADEKLEPEQLARTIDMGQFERIFSLPQSAFDILQVGGDPDLVIAWADLAGEAIVQVVETELYRIASPSEFRDRKTLERVLALQDPAAIQKLMGLNQVDQDLLLGLPTEQTRSVLMDLSTEDLSWLTIYLAELPLHETNLLVDRILQEPALMSKLRFEDMRQALLESPNIQETLDFLASQEESAVGQVTKVLEDTERVISREVPWQLFWRKYGTLPNMLYLLSSLLILYLLLRWGIFRRRQSGMRMPGVNVTVNIPERSPKTSYSRSENDIPER